MAKKLVKALESPAIIESVSRPEKSKGRKDRINIELAQFREKKIALEKEKETLTERIWNRGFNQGSGRSEKP